MSLKDVKTIGYDFFLDHLIQAMDLYEHENRNSKLRSKHSYSNKQDAYIEEDKDGFHQKLISVLGDQSHDVSRRINGILDFSEIATSFVLSKDFIAPISKEELYQRYAKHILCPLLISYMELFINFYDESPFMKHLNDLLLSPQEKGLPHAVRNFLRGIINATEYKENYDIVDSHEDLVKLIKNIKSDKKKRPNIRQRHTTEQPTIRQRRATYLPKITSAMDACKKIQNPADKQEYLHRLTMLRDAYIASMAFIYFDNETGLGQYLATQWQATISGKAGHTDIPRSSLSDSIELFILNNPTHGNELSEEAKHHLNCLWEASIQDVHKIQYFNEIMRGEPDMPESIFTGDKELEAFFYRVATQEHLYYLKPYALVLQTLNHIKHGRLQAALDLLDSKEALALNEISGHYISLAAMLFIGLKIKLFPRESKNGNFNPFVSIIINSQELFIEPLPCASEILKLEYESFITNSYSNTILRSIKQYNDIVLIHLDNPENYEDHCILDTWENIELALKKINSKLEKTSINDRTAALTKIIAEEHQEGPLITYLPNSTLYHCVRELEGILSYKPVSAPIYPHMLRLTRDIEYRKALLMALNPDQYAKDSLS